MSIFTSIWNLLKKNPATDGDETFNIETMLNDNWDKLDAALGLKAANADVRAATIASIALTGLQTVDGVALAAGDRVLAKNQTAAAENGIYVAADGAWTRAADADSAAKLAAGVHVYVREGSANAGTGWALTTTGAIALGTTALTFAQKAGAGAATDAVIGTRAVDDTVAAAAGADTPTRLWSKLAYMIKAVTGKSNWYTLPVTTIEALNASVSSHNADTTKHVPYAAASGSANAYTVTLSPAPASLTPGLALAVLINAANTGASTINVNGLGAKSILTSKGAALTSGKLVANGVYTLRYNGTAFILQGEGGEYGTAGAGQVLTGYTVGTESGLVSGSMANNGALSYTPSASAQAIPAGYTSGGTVAAVTNLSAANIKSGVTVGGVAGTFTSDATAAAAQILSGYTAYNNGSKVTGTITNYTYDPSATAMAHSGTTVGLRAPQGYYDGNRNVNYVEPNLLASNIKSGVSIFGVAGSVIAGKRIASGTTTSGSTIGTFYTWSGSAPGTAYYLLTVTGLSFTPRVIYCRYVNASAVSYIVSVVDTALVYNGFPLIGTETSEQLRIGQGSSYVSSGAFGLPVRQASASYQWYAVEA